jgi:LEA14-like dessication related protein
MSRSLTLRAAALAAVAFSLASCASLQDLARAAFERPRLAFRSASIAGLDLEGATVALEFNLENPNGFGLDVARVGYGLEVEGTRIATGDLPGGLTIPPRGAAPLTVPVRVRFADVPGIVSLLTSGRDQIRYRVSGNVGVNTPIGVVELPMAHEDHLALPSLPRFALDGLSVRSASLTEVALDVKVRVTNPNRFGLPAGKIGYALSVAGNPVARADGAPVAAVAGNGASTIALPVKVSLLRAGQAAVALDRGGEVDVALQGEAKVAGLPLPLDLKARLPARR